MIVLASPRLAVVAAWLRQAILVLAALFVAHDAIYIARYGIGDGYAHAMAAQGHDAYWAPMAIVLAVGVLLVGLGTALAYRRLANAAAGGQPSGRGLSYPAELGGVWLRLFPTVAALFAIQENVEHLVVEGHVGGLAPLGGLTLPVLAATTFVLAALGALVRWRIRGLAAAVAAAARPRLRPAVRLVHPARWQIVGAIVARRWTIGRLDAGRAPPGGLHDPATTA
jgi:hypothetical protein